ncbi:MAG: hypothetical protein ABMA00_11775 [Gemmatimonas sp.]
MDGEGEKSRQDIRALIAAHGTLAAGLVSAVQQITGRGAVFLAMSNSSLSLSDIQDSLARALDETGARVIFTDLPAGSCTMAVRKLMRARTDITLVTGANLPLLLDFAMQDDVDAVAAAHAALERGRVSMTAHGA